MTGIEGAAVLGAVAKVASVAASEDPSENETLRRVAEEAGALQPAAEAYAKRVAVKQHIRLKLVQPLGRIFGLSKDYFDTHFADEMADRMSGVEDEDVVTPPTSVAGPSILGIGFTVEEPELRAMYLNLLATASTRQIQKSAHPAFAEIIRQISSDEAKLLPSVFNGPQDKPVVKIIFSHDDTSNGYVTVETNVLEVHSPNGQVRIPQLSTFVDNWIRLGLVEVSFDEYLISEERYAWVDESPAMVDARSAYAEIGDGKIDTKKGILRITDFGRLFNSAVLPTAALAEPGMQSA